jgi:hypothetical protein
MHLNACSIKILTSLVVLSFIFDAFAINPQHCLDVLKTLDQRRFEVRPPKLSLESFNHLEFVQVGTGSLEILERLQPTSRGAHHRLPDTHGLYLGIYERPVFPGSHLVTLVHPTNSSGRIISGSMFTVPHDSIFPLHTGSKEVVLSMLQVLHNSPLTFEVGETVRHRSSDGMMLLGVVKSIHKNTLKIHFPGAGIESVPKNKVFKIVQSGDGDLILPGQVFVPEIPPFVSNVILKPNFSHISDVELRFASAQLHPIKDEAIEAILNGAAKFTSLPHFLKQKPETQLEFLLAFYRKFMQSHPLGRYIDLFGINDIELFARSSLSDVLQDISILGTMLVESGFQVKAVVLPKGERTHRVWFEVTRQLPQLQQGETKTFILDPDLSLMIDPTLSQVLDYEALKVQSFNQPNSDAAWVYFNPSRIILTL